MLKIAVLAPMAMPRVKTVIRLAPSWRRSKREAKRMSCAAVPTNVPIGMAMFLRYLQPANLQKIDARETKQLALAWHNRRT